MYRYIKYCHMYINPYDKSKKYVSEIICKLYIMCRDKMFESMDEISKKKKYLLILHKLMRVNFANRFLRLFNLFLVLIKIVFFK